MKHLAVFVLAISLVMSCSTTATMPIGGGQRTEFQQGARDFPNGDNIVIEEVLSSNGKFETGATVIVRGSYDLRERGSAILYFGTTEATGPGLHATDPRQTLIVSQGTGRFELVHTIPGPGYPHVTFYDRTSGVAFGGVYFGRGETLLAEKSWAYSR